MLCMSYQADYITTIPTHNTGCSSPVNEDYSNLLLDHGLKFKKVGYLFCVGEIVPVQGWILHISAIRSQIIRLFGSCPSFSGFCKVHHLKLCQI